MKTVMKLCRGKKKDLIKLVGEEFTEKHERLTLALLTDTKELFVLDVGEYGDPMRVGGVILKGSALGRSRLEEGQFHQAGALTIGTDDEDYVFDGVIITTIRHPEMDTVNFLTYLLPTANIVERL